jgi:hypothetical protein
MIDCPVCGSRNPDDAHFCGDCGHDFTSAQAAPPPEAAPVETGPSPSLEERPVVPPPPQVGAARLTLKRSGALTSESFGLGERCTVGRFDPDSGPVDVDLGPLPEAAYVSRHHAQIWQDGTGQWFVKDLGSRNGTFCRTTGQDQFQRVTGEQAIQDGDEIALGNARFEFRVG